MKRINIHIALTERELKSEMKKFRFTGDELPVVLMVHRELLPKIKAEAYYEKWSGTEAEKKRQSGDRQEYTSVITSEDALRDGQKGTDKEKKERESSIQQDYIVYVTLGEEPDRLQERYEEQEQILLAYITECLSMIYLSYAYKKIVAAMEVQEKCNFCKLCFWEDKYRIEQLVQTVDKAKQTNITCTGEGFLKPSKSVVMFVTLLKDSIKPVKNLCKVRDEPKAYLEERDVTMLMCSRCRHKCERGRIQ